MRIDYAIIFVSDMERSIAFYRDIFGLPLKFETPDWTEFSTEGATLALHKGGESRPVAAGPDTTAPGQCRPGIVVESLDKFHAIVTEKGVTCVQAPKNVFGARIAQYLDPDGLVVSVSENRSGA